MKAFKKFIIRLGNLLCYIRVFCFLSYKKMISSGILFFEWRQIIGRGFFLQINNGSLVLGERIHSRNFLSIIVNNGTCTIGNRCFFNHNCSITCLNKITISDGCTFGNNVVIVDHDHDLNNRDKFVLGDISIGENTWVGANVVILRDSHIGNNCVIGAGVVVKGNIPDDTIFIQKRQNYLKMKK